MKLDIPIRKQASFMDCGATCLKMVFDYFESGISYPEISRQIAVREGYCVFANQLALASAELGFITSLYQLSSDSPNRDSSTTDYYDKYTDSQSESVADYLLDMFYDLGGRIFETSVDNDSLLKKLSPDPLIISIVNHNMLIDKAGYSGHFVPITGYDANNVLVHNVSQDWVQPFFPVPRETFDKARKSPGTLESFIVIKRK